MLHVPNIFKSSEIIQFLITEIVFCQNDDADSVSPSHKDLNGSLLTLEKFRAKLYNPLTKGRLPRLDKADFHEERK